MHHASHYDRTPRSRQEDTVLGPVVSGNQFNKIQQLISAGIREGATLVTGGIGRPEGLNRGYYVRPTVFGDVEPPMTIAREEIFGPVLSIMPYDTEDQAVEIANDTVYGLSACVVSTDIELAPRLARCERCRHRITRREPRTIESPIRSPWQAPYEVEVEVGPARNASTSWVSVQPFTAPAVSPDTM